MTDKNQDLSIDQHEVNNQRMRELALVEIARLKSLNLVALHNAVSNGDLIETKRILEMDLAKANNEHRLALLEIAKRNGHLEIIELLQHNFNPINHCDHKLET